MFLLPSLSPQSKEEVKNMVSVYLFSDMVEVWQIFFKGFWTFSPFFYSILKVSDNLLGSPAFRFSTANMADLSSEWIFGFLLLKMSHKALDHTSRSIFHNYTHTKKGKTTHLLVHCVILLNLNISSFFAVYFIFCNSLPRWIKLFPASSWPASNTNIIHFIIGHLHLFLSSCVLFPFYFAGDPIYRGWNQTLYKP